MKLMFANSAWVSAPERLIQRGGGWSARRLRVRYGVFLHPVAGPVLIDTGYTAHSLEAPGRSRWLRAYGRALGPELNDAGQPERVLQGMGLEPKDVTRIIVTHFHADHVSGLAAFPNARFMASGAAWARVQSKSAFQNVRHGVFRELMPLDFETRLMPVEAQTRTRVAHLGEAYDLFEDGRVLAVPLPGHADGHLGVLFPQEAVPLLYATDVQWVRQALSPAARPRLAPRLIGEDYAAMCESTDRVEAFRAAGQTVLLCHDDALTAYDADESVLA